MESSFLALPDKGSDKAYQLLLKALEDTDEVGIAQFVMHQREYTVFIRPRNNGITIHTLFYENEIRQIAGYGEKPKNLQLKRQEVKLAEQLIASLSEKFEPAKYHDRYQEQLRALVEAKQKGKAFVEKAPPKKAKVIDMMDALRQSLQQAAAAPGAKRRRAASHEKRRAAS